MRGLAAGCRCASTPKQIATVPTDSKPMARALLSQGEEATSLFVVLARSFAGLLKIGAFRGFGLTSLLGRSHCDLKPTKESRPRGDLRGQHWR